MAGRPWVRVRIMVIIRVRGGVLGSEGGEGKVRILELSSTSTM